MRFKRRRARFKGGDYLIQSDLTGREMYASESRKLWNGLICHRDEVEIRNPQDLIKARPERRPLREVRPRTVQFIDKPVEASDL